ncbi:MAG: hypothetical protein NVSMB12_19650 [Acidimicrobiales bacterium]
MSLPPERRRQLQELGLRALIKRRFGADVAASARSAATQGLVALLAEGPDGALAAAFADDPSGLAAAVDLTVRGGAAHLYFFCEQNSPEIARRAAAFSVAVTVVAPDGDFETLRPAPPEGPVPMPDVLAPYADRFRAAALDPVWEHGVLTGEWLGLEVARAVLTDETVAYDVGVGKHDREGNRLLYPDGPTPELLAHAVATVAAIRTPRAAPHPANQLVPDRWLRRVLMARPALIGLTVLTAAPPPEARTDLRQRGVAPAWGLDAAGRPVAVVCSVGVDPDVVAQAADTRILAPLWPGVPASHAPASPWRVLIVVPEGDDHPLTRRCATLLRDPAEVVTIPTDWRALGAL